MADLTNQTPGTPEAERPKLPRRALLLGLAAGTGLSLVLDGCSVPPMDMSHEQAAEYSKQESEQFRKLIEPAAEDILAQVQAYEKNFLALGGPTLTGKSQDTVWWGTTVKHGEDELTIVYNNTEVNTASAQTVHDIHDIFFTLVQGDKTIRYHIDFEGGQGVHGGGFPGRWFARKETQNHQSILAPLEVKDTYADAYTYNLKARQEQMAQALKNGRDIVNGESSGVSLLSLVSGFLGKR